MFSQSIRLCWPEEGTQSSGLSLCCARIERSQRSKLNLVLSYALVSIQKVHWDVVYQIEGLSFTLNPFHFLHSNDWLLVLSLPSSVRPAPGCLQ